ncbi:restriction endonuclease [Streptomyces erythrochromogenes]|uniref:restriction endonuclease n=1 Tax=Streptomyces erythrochromogenes TaxID=285574 RepID=UPI0038200EE7|nr:restriction endonuclease [Streptomyces erythrochromogenes]WSR88234.1 restriction endonuclease [Streptomyces erythrochromogenes]
MSARRRPVRRTSRRRPRRRKNRSLEQVLLAALAATVAISLVVGVLRWLAGHPWVVVLAVLAGAGAGGAWMWRRKEAARWERVRAQGLRYAVEQLDRLHHTQFEFAVRDLMHRDGCADAQRVGGRGDNGADVKATDPFGRRWVIQCKHRRAGWSGKPVGTPELHVLNGTGRQVHHGDVLVMLTNGRITSNAVDFAQDQRLHLVDRRVLAEWAAGSRPLWELLRAVPAPRRGPPLS